MPKAVVSMAYESEKYVLHAAFAPAQVAETLRGTLWGEAGCVRLCKPADTTDVVPLYKTD